MKTNITLSPSVFERYKSYLDGLRDIISKPSYETIPTSLQYKDKDTVMAVFSSLDWSFAEDDTTYLSHDIHPYPAKFPPQLPAQVITLLSSKGEMIWDPFGGSGTTALEALLNDRNCISTDVNPIGSIIGRAKTTALCSEDEIELNRLIDRLEYYSKNISFLGEYFEEHRIELEKEIPSIPNIEKWFNSSVICELAFIKHLIKNELQRAAAANVARASLSKIITRVSNQESETTYRAVERQVSIGEAIDAFLKDLKSNYSKIKALSNLIGYRTSRFITMDVMQSVVGENKPIEKEEVDLIVTSPPYPNAFDYHLYHRFRIFWLDGDPVDVGRVEIGSHLKYQRSKKNFEQFEEEMEPVLVNCLSALKSGRYAVFILGNAVFEGVEYKTAERIGLLAQKVGFEYVGIINRPLPETKRSVKSWARRATTEQILILRKPITPSKVELIPVDYRLWPYEKTISDLERQVLCHSDSDNFEVAGPIDISPFKNLTFYKAFTVNGTEFKTWQSILEHGQDDDASRKDPKYLTHGIHPYKGKFYPQLVRPLLNILGIPKGGVVFDPFCGSGTVALESILNGYNAFGCDINPTAVEIAVAKNTIFKVEPYEFQKQVFLFEQELLTYSDSDDDFSGWFDKEAIGEIRSWFPDKVISKMGFIISRISKVPDDRIRRFLKVILSSIIREISQQDPGDLRIRRRKEPIDDASVIEMYLHHLKKQSTNIMGYYAIRNNAPETIGDAYIWRGNSKDYDDVSGRLSDSSVDIVITSPPYATALPYIDTNRLNMLVLGGINASKRVPIEAEMTGTREINKSTRETYERCIRADDYGCIVSDTAKQVISEIYKGNENADVGFRKKNMAALIYMYFRDMMDVMQTLDKVVKTGGYICVVIGDTKTTTGAGKVIIRTTQVLRETGEHMGWRLVSDIPISVTKEKYVHMNNSITENDILIFRK